MTNGTAEQILLIKQRPCCQGIRRFPPLDCFDFLPASIMSVAPEMLPTNMTGSSSSRRLDISLLLTSIVGYLEPIESWSQRLHLSVDFIRLYSPVGAPGIRGKFKAMTA